MRAPLALKERPSAIFALELLGIDNSQVPEVLLHHALDIVNLHLGHHGKEESSLVISGTRAIRVVPIEPAGKPLFFYLVSIPHLQASLALEGVLVRGAVTIGRAAARNNVIVGRGLVEAESLRDECANVPRVIIDPRLIQDIESNPNLGGSRQTTTVKLDFFRLILREDSDGLWFFDYLKLAGKTIGAPEGPTWLLEEHRQFIERNLKASTTLDRTSRGYTWLRNYHNRVIDELFDEKRLGDAERSRLRIPATSPLVYAFPPSALKP